MTFLKNIDPSHRLAIQYKAFLSTKNLSFLETTIDIPSFNKVFILSKESDLENLQVKSNLRLGNRLEYFLSFALESSEDFEILAKNIQIVENKITLGELDYIIEDKTSETIFHLELANKFYLYDPNIKTEINCWIGPNRNDSLIRKITKLKNKQFPLLHHKQTVSQLTDLGIDVSMLSQKLLFKTQLFLPKTMYLEQKENDNIEGFYISKEDFLNKEYQGSLFFVPEKQDWQVHPQYCVNWFSYQTIQANVHLFLNENKSPLVWMQTPKGMFQKFFIVWW